MEFSILDAALPEENLLTACPVIFESIRVFSLLISFQE
jgi:hypothetical protein